MLQEIELKAQKRETGKHAAKKIRRDGDVPGVFYAKGVAPISICVQPLALRPIVHTAHVRLVNLEVDGSTKKCVLKDVKFHPVTDKIIHFDLLGIHDEQKLTVEVPFEFVGQPIGVRKGGNFQQVFHKCKITCLPKNLVSSIEVNISDLDLGQSVHLRDLNLDGIDFSIPTDSLLCAVNMPRGKAAEALQAAAGA